MAGAGVPDAAYPAAVGAGSLRAEPYATWKLSVPIDVSGGGRPGAGVTTGRIGLRHRTFNHVAFGGGLGPSVYWDEGGSLFGPRTLWGANVDVEVAAGFRRRRWGLSSVVRPTLNLIEGGGASFYGVMGIAPAFYVRDRVAVTGHLIGGPATLGGDIVHGFLGGGLGVFVEL
jgi:hypothetical protein